MVYPFKMMFNLFESDVEHYQSSFSVLQQCEAFYFLLLLNVASFN